MQQMNTPTQEAAMETVHTQKKREDAAREEVRTLAQSLPFPRRATNAQVVQTLRAMQDELEIAIKILSPLDSDQGSQGASLDKRDS
jgi:hypothetical protein